MSHSPLEVFELSKSYGQKKVLDKISLEAQRGEILGILGPNGAGKTTLIRIVLDILEPSSGQVRIFGDDYNKSQKSLIGYLPEERGLYKDETVARNLEYFARLKGVDVKPQEIDRWLKKVGYFEYRDKKVKSLSKGMSQIIQFVGSIIHNPKLIILDEPFYGLDPINARLLKKIIVESRDAGKDYSFEHSPDG